jgi:hypothetical protein
MEIETIEVREFTPSQGLTSVEATALLEKWGRNELEEKKKSHVRDSSFVCY